MTFDEKIDLLAQLTLRAYACYQVWWIYQSADTRPKYLERMNRFSEFFRFDSHAHFVTMIMYLSQLFEPRADTVNLDSLVQEAQAVGVDVNERDKAWNVLAQAKAKAAKITILRSNLFAHRSSKLSHSEVFQKASIAPREFYNLMNCGLQVVNIFAKSRGRPVSVFHDLTRRDTLAMLEALGELPAGGA